MVELREDVVHNLLREWQKRDISPYYKGKLIQEYLAEKKISQRQLARDLDMSHTTIQTWISFAKNLEPGQYEELVDAGVSKEQIYEVARAKYKGMNTNPLDIILSRVLFVMSKDPPVSAETIRRAKRVVSELQSVISKSGGGD